MGRIYVITNNINGKQYVGQTIRSIKSRFKQHLTAQDKKTYALYKAMNKYGKENFSISLLEECDDSLLNEREKYWIKVLDTYHNGYNETLGGEGTNRFDYFAIVSKFLETKRLKKTADFFDCSIDTVRSACLSYDIEPRKIYLQTISTKYDYKQIADKYIELQNAKKTAEYFGCDVKVVHNACIKNNVQMLSNGDIAKKELSKPVRKINIETGKEIITYPSVSDAARDLGDKAYVRNIVGCCNKRWKTAYGFGWEFLDSPKGKIDYRNKKFRVVGKFDKDTDELIQIYKSGAEAARSIGGGESQAGTILKVCRNPKLQMHMDINGNI